MDKQKLKSLSSWSTDSEIVQLTESDDWLLFREEVSRTTRYAEWGSGLSTVYVAMQEKIEKTVSVETDSEWAKLVSSTVKGLSSRVTVEHVDLGPVGKWGRPEGYSKIDNVWSYSAKPFQGKFNPDLILVDGRFRVHCFLEAIVKGKKGTRIIFDDYAVRPSYHEVENFIKPRVTNGRQALFEVNTKFYESREIRKLSKKFTYVMD